MGADLNNIVKCQKLTDDHIQFLIYQLLRGLKVKATGTFHLIIYFKVFVVHRNPVGFWAIHHTIHSKQKQENEVHIQIVTLIN